MPARGSGQFGPDVLVGSSEYAKRMREKNPTAHKLAQVRYRLKQKQLILAAKIAVEDGISPEQALAEVTAKVDATVQLRSELINTGRIDHIDKPVVVEGETFIPEIAKEAKERGVPYALVKAEWDAGTSWGNLEQLAAAKGLIDDTKTDTGTDE